MYYDKSGDTYRKRFQSEDKKIDMERKYEKSLLQFFIQDFLPMLEEWDEIKGGNPAISTRFRWELGKKIFEFYEEHDLEYVECSHCGMFQAKHDLDEDSEDDYGEGYKIREECGVCKEPMDLEAENFKTVTDIKRRVSKYRKLREGKNLITPNLSDESREKVKEVPSPSTVETFKFTYFNYETKDEIPVKNKNDENPEGFSWSQELIPMINKLDLYPQFLMDKYLEMVENDEIREKYVVWDEVSESTDTDRSTIERAYRRTAADKLAAEFEDFFNPEFDKEKDRFRKKPAPEFIWEYTIFSKSEFRRKLK